MSKETAPIPRKIRQAVVSRVLQETRHALDKGWIPAITVLQHSQNKELTILADKNIDSEVIANVLQKVTDAVRFGDVEQHDDGLEAL